MINEVINEILKAEEQAELIVENAQNQAQEILAKSEEDVISIQKATAEECKNLRSKIKAESEEIAQSEYVRIMGEATQECEKLTAEKGANADDAGEYIFGRILNGNC